MFSIDDFRVDGESNGSIKRFHCSETSAVATNAPIGKLSSSNNPTSLLEKSKLRASVIPPRDGLKLIEGVDRLFVPIW